MADPESREFMSRLGNDIQGALGEDNAAIDYLFNAKNSEDVELLAEQVIANLSTNEDNSDDWFASFLGAFVDGESNQGMKRKGKRDN